MSSQKKKKARRATHQRGSKNCGLPTLLFRTKKKEWGQIRGTTDRPLREHGGVTVEEKKRGKNKGTVGDPLYDLPKTGKAGKEKSFNTR